MDVTGISGEGIVATGTVFDEPMRVEWPDGKVLDLPAGWVRMVWRGPDSSTVLWPDLDTAMKVNGHGGRTRAVFTGGTVSSGWGP